MHIALQQQRRLDVVWDGKEIAIYDGIKTLAQTADAPVPEFVKLVLAKIVQSRRGK